MSLRPVFPCLGHEALQVTEGPLPPPPRPRAFALTEDQAFERREKLCARSRMVCTNFCEVPFCTAAEVQEAAMPWFAGRCSEGCGVGGGSHERELNRGENASMTVVYGGRSNTLTTQFMAGTRDTPAITARDT